MYSDDVHEKAEEIIKGGDFRSLTHFIMENGLCPHDLINIAVTYGKLGIAKFLFKQASVKMNRKKYKFLRSAVLSGSINMVNFILGGDVSKISSETIKEISDIAIRGDFLEVLKIFHSHGMYNNKESITNWLNIAVNERKIKSVEFFIDLGGELTSTLLWTASYQQDVEMLDFLLSKGIKPDGHSLSGGITEVKILKMLVDAGARDPDGSSVQLAIRYNCNKSAMFLLESGIPLNKISKEIIKKDLSMKKWEDLSVEDVISYLKVKDIQDE